MRLLLAIRERSEAAPSLLETSCSHYSCTACMGQYVVKEVRGHRYPVKCPSTGCGLKIESLMRDHLQELAV
jgi:hypothetical protein